MSYLNYTGECIIFKLAAFSCLSSFIILVFCNDVRKVHSNCAGSLTCRGLKSVQSDALTEAFGESLLLLQPVICDLQVVERSAGGRFD